MSIRKTVPISEADWSIAPRPPWVEVREPDWQFVPQEGFAVAFLLVDEQHHVATQAIYYHTFRRALTHAAVQSLGQSELDFDPAAHRLRIHELSVWRQSFTGSWEKRSVMRQDDFLIRQREQQLEQQILNGRASIVALIEDFRVDDVIELAWTLEPRDPLQGLRFTAFQAFAWSFPVARVFYTLHLDVSAPVFWRMHAHERMLEPSLEVGGNQATWSQANPSLFVQEPNAPGDQWPFPMLEVSGWKEWSEVARFMSRLWEDALKEGATETAEEVSRLTVANDLAASVCAAIRFVQEKVRYLAVDFGHGGGILPNGAGTVLRRRFGDCKDKAVLLTAMLRELGLEAWPLLVAPNWREAVARVQPSTAAFGHAIVTFIVNGDRYTVDPTLIGQGGDLARMLPTPYGFGLEVSEGKGDLLPLAELPPAELLLTETFSLNRSKPDEGAVEQVLSATSWLANDLRAMLLRGGPAAFFKQRTEALQKHFPALLSNDRSSEVTDNLPENLIKLHARYALPTWGPETEGPPVKFTYGGHGLFLALEYLGGPEKRAQPWVLRHPMKVQHKVIVRGRCVQNTKQERHRFDGPGFSYTCDVTARRHEVIFDYCWQTTAPKILPEEWPEYCKQRAKALDHAGANVGTSGFWLRKKLINVRVVMLLVYLLVVGISYLAHFLFSPDRSRGSSSTAELDDAYRSMKIAAETMDRGEYKAALPLLENLRPYYVRSIAYHLMRADAALRTNHFDRARESLVAARELDPSNSKIDVIEAMLFEKIGDLAAARKILDRLLLRMPDDEGILVSKARVTQQLGDKDAAIQAWQKLLTVSPAHADGLLSYALLIWKSGDQQRADKTILDAIHSQPTPSPLLESALSQYYVSTNRLAESAEAAKRATLLAPSSSSVAFLNAMAQARVGNKTKAIKLARQMTRQFPGQTSGWQALAVIAATSEQPEVARSAFLKWLEIAPNESEVQASYGFFLYKTGNMFEARRVLERASRNFPGDGLVWLNYSVVLSAQGESQAAGKARQKANALMSDESIKGLIR